MNSAPLKEQTTKGSVSFFGKNSEKGKLNIDGHIDVKPAAGFDVSVDEGKQNETNLKEKGRMVIGDEQLIAPLQTDKENKEDEEILRLLC